MARSFGTRRKTEHGHVVLNARSRVICRILDRGGSAIYLELAEPVPLPYSFQVSLDADEHIICEVKSQRGTVVVGLMVGRSPISSFDRSAAVSADEKPMRDDYDRWAGLRPSRGFKV